jgi:hypothetical protein
MINTFWYGAERLPTLPNERQEEEGVEHSVKTFCFLRFVRESKS